MRKWLILLALLAIGCKHGPRIVGEWEGMVYQQGLSGKEHIFSKATATTRAKPTTSGQTVPRRYSFGRSARFDLPAISYAFISPTSNGNSPAPTQIFPSFKPSSISKRPNGLRRRTSSPPQKWHSRTTTVSPSCLPRAMPAPITAWVNPKHSEGSLRERLLGQSGLERTRQNCGDR